MAGSALLVPLYVYPFEGAWQPLYDAMVAHPQTQFLVVINPYNGPGPDALPDANYCREIPKLRSHSNVAVFGYVHVQWAQRQLDAVLQDVGTYAAWPNQHNHPHQPLRVDGIFVDETPTAADARTVDFLGSLTSIVHRIWPSKDPSGDTPPVWTPVHRTAQTPTIIHNPGCMPAPALLELSDLCVVFEDTWTVFLQRVRDGIFDEPEPASTPSHPTRTPPNTEATTPALNLDLSLGTAANKPPAGDGAAAKAFTGGNAAAGAATAATRPQAQSQNHELLTPPPIAGQEASPSSSQNNGNVDAHANGWAADAFAALDAAATSVAATAVVAAPATARSQGVVPARSKRAVVVHSVPLPDHEHGDGNGNGNGDGQQRQREALVSEVIVAARRVAGTVFVTELSVDYYARFGRGWREWAGVVGGEE